MDIGYYGNYAKYRNRKRECVSDVVEKRFGENMFPDRYFECLYQRTFERLKRENIYLRQVYLFQNAVSSEQFRIYGLFLEKANRQEAEECYFQKLIEENQLISVFPMLMVEDELLGEREAVTRILIPRLDVSNVKRSLISSNVIAQLQFANCLSATNFFAYGEAKKISDQEISDYIWDFTQKEQYLLLVDTLFHYFQEFQFNDYYSSEGPFYIPFELMDYYHYWQKNRNSSNELRGKGISKQLLRKLK